VDFQASTALEGLDVKTGRIPAEDRRRRVFGRDLGGRKAPDQELRREL